MRIRGQKRRALSTVVTSVMLVSAVSMLGAALVSWSNSNFAVQRMNVANAVDNRINQVREGFVVEDVWFYSEEETNYATVTIRNTGDVAVNVSYILVDNARLWSEGRVIPSGAVDSITFADDWGSDTEQYITVATERGTLSKQLWKIT